MKTMCEGNQTQVTAFVLLGFRSLPNLKLLLFTLFLLVYVALLAGNLLIVVLVTINDHLKNIPMFYFLKHLSSADVLLTTSIVPLMLSIIIMDGMVVSVVGCIIQFSFFGVSGFVQGYLLAVMSLDRYLAIRCPLRYTVIMSPRLCFQLVSGCWFIVFTITSSEVAIIGQLEFCDQNDIDHFFCDLLPLAELATSDTSMLLSMDFSVAVIGLCIPFNFIISTYLLIFFMITRIRSVSGRRKFFSTCSSHLTSVCTYYVTLTIVYMAPSGENSATENKFRSLLYIVGIPLVNPIIYSLRNQEIKAALNKVLHYLC
uniref:G-protein coupled receptors family 1 profile domain-containing protein n=1 Tax=Leptobrachium leishanense TaxID=445787 RepID=A0A8C5M9Y9_9ANUR